MEVGESIFKKWTRSCSATELSLVARVVNRRAQGRANMVKRWILGTRGFGTTLPSLRRPEVDPGALPCVASEFDPS